MTQDDSTHGRKEAAFTGKYRDHEIIVRPHDFEDICSIDCGGAIIYGEPRISGKTNTFEVWQNTDGEQVGKLVVSEPLEEDQIGEIYELIKEVREA